MAARDNERIVRRFFDEVLSGRSLDAADQLVAAEIVDHTPLLTDAPAGLEGVKQLARALHATYGGAFTNLQINLEDLFTAGADRVIARWVMEGAQTGEFLGRPASNENVRLAGIDIFRVADNKIVERWGQVDRQELLAQFDAPAAPAGAAAGGATSDAQRPATAAPGGAAVTRAARAAAPSGSLAGQGSAPVAGAGTSADDSSGPVGAAAEQGLGTPQVTRMVRDDLQRDPLALTETVRYGFMRRLESQEPVLVRYSERETFDPIPDAEGGSRRLAIYEGDIILGPAEQVKAWSSDILAPAITGITGAGAAGGRRFAVSASAGQEGASRSSSSRDYRTRSESRGPCSTGSSAPASASSSTRTSLTGSSSAVGPGVRLTSANRAVLS